MDKPVKSTAKPVGAKSAAKPKSGASPQTSRAPFECIALLLQGGGALGAYQAGVYEALAEAGLHPDWVSGISIGAINSAIIAGNPPEHRVEKLRAFWERITTSPFGSWHQGPLFDATPGYANAGDAAHGLFDQISANQAMFAGVPGFFKPRFPPPFMCPPGAPGATSFYDTSDLRGTLESLIDFDRINAGETRLSVGAVNVRTGNFTYFENTNQTIGPEHVMASGALPPGFPAVEIEGQLYWDGGLVSNTPLSWLFDAEERLNTLVFQVDLWSSRGEFPRDMTGVALRQKEIQYSSRTRAATNRIQHAQKIRASLSALLDKLPAELKTGPEIEALCSFADKKVYNIVQLIYRSKYYEGNTKDYEFSRASMNDHWLAGFNDATRALRHKEIFECPDDLDGCFSFDFQE